MKKSALLLQFDIETLSLHPTHAVVGEIGVHAMHLEFDTTKMNSDVVVTQSAAESIKFDMEHQHYEQGRRIDVSTLQWWLTQNEAARSEMAVNQNRCALSTGMFKLDGFIRTQLGYAEQNNSAVYVLSSAPAFDMVNIRTMYGQAAMHHPWAHWQEHSQRTLRSLYPKEKLPERDTTLIAHSGAGDAQWQNEVLLHILNDKDTPYAREALLYFFNLI